MSTYSLYYLFLGNPALRRWTLQRIIFLFPVLALAAAVGFFAETVYFQSKAKQTKAEIVQVYARQGENFIEHGKTVYSPVFTYIWSDGKPTRASTGQAHSTPFREGEKHTILFDPAAKGDVRLTTFEQLWALPVTLMLIGLATLLPAMAIWLWIIRPRIKHPCERRLFKMPGKDDHLEAIR